MLDFDLAELYGIETKALNQAVRRNSERFPDDFMFRLDEVEWHLMWSQFVTTSDKRRRKSCQPYAFTEHGVTMLASVLKSESAIKMNIAIVRAFISMRKAIIDFKDISGQLSLIKEKIANHDVQLNEIYTAIENLLDFNSSQKSWDDRQRIGYKD